MVLTREYISGIIKEMGGIEVEYSPYFSSTYYSRNGLLWNVATSGCELFDITGDNIHFHIHYSSKHPIHLYIL